MAGISLAELVQLKGSCLFCSWQSCAQHPAQGTQLLPPPAPPAHCHRPAAWGLQNQCAQCPYAGIGDMAPARVRLSLPPALHTQHTRNHKPNVLAMTDKQPKRCESSRRQREKRHWGLGGLASFGFTEPCRVASSSPHCWAAHEMPPPSQLQTGRPATISQCIGGDGCSPAPVTGGHMDPQCAPCPRGARGLAVLLSPSS